MSMSDMAERMMVNLKTVQRMEKGDPAVGIGIAATALWVLGLHRRLGDLWRLKATEWPCRKTSRICRAIFGSQRSRRTSLIFE